MKNVLSRYCLLWVPPVAFALAAIPMRADTIDYSYTGGSQTFTATTAGVYYILAYGAQGGAGVFSSPALGAEIGGDFTLSANETLIIDVGGTGVASSDAGGGAGGGGGGTFVVDSEGNPLVVAGGGGGGAAHSSGTNASTTTSGTAGIYGGAGGASGSGGVGYSYGGGGGGGGGSFLAADCSAGVTSDCLADGNETIATDAVSPDGSYNGYVEITQMCSIAPTPEPPSLTLVALGLLGIAVALKRRGTA
jgi:Glycine rich protein/PEP-CTERM motif